MTFTLTSLLNGSVLVEGTDSKGKDGSTILHSDRWSLVKATRAHKIATEEFNAVVDEFFRPLTDAADKAKAQVSAPDNQWRTITLTNGVEGVDAEIVELDDEGVLLRILEETDGSTLRWIGSNTLVAIA